MRRHPFFPWLPLVLLFFALSGLPAHAGLTCNAGTADPYSVQSTPDSDFLSLGTDVVIHGKTGLWWKACSEGLNWLANSTCSGTASALNWQNALMAANTANTTAYGGFTDWRLPNKKELESIVETCGHLPAINMTAFLDGPSRNYWSSSTNINTPTQAWGVGFGDGGTFAGLKTDANLVRLVRGPGLGNGLGDGVAAYDLVHPTASVIYLGNGNNGGTVPVDGHSYASGAAATVLGNTGGLTRNNFNFSGWNLMSNGLGNNYLPGNTFTMGSLNVVLFANWTSLDSELIDLTTSVGSLSPVFTSPTLAYTVSIPNANSFITVTPKSADPTAAIMVSYFPVVSGSASQKINIPVGTYTVPITVTALGGKAVTNYKITVSRANAVPNAPTIGSVLAGPGHATVSFSTTIAGGLATSFTASCVAAGHATRTGSGTASPVIVAQLSGGVVYSCSVAATNGLGTSASSASVAVTPRTDLTPVLMLLLD